MKKIVVPTMKLNNGIEMPAIGLGTYLSKDIRTAVKVGIKVGFRMFDTAFIFMNENAIGKAIKERIEEGFVQREDLFILSKLWNTHHSSEKVVPALKKTLENLGTPYLDLFLIHWPFAFKGDDFALYGEQENISIEETWKCMEECVRLGLTKSIGVSNFNESQIQRILDVAEIKPVVNQVECHPFFNQKSMIDFCKQENIIVMAYSPLFKYFDDSIFFNEVITKIAKNHGTTNSQVSLKYLIQLGAVPIPKSDKPIRIKKNIDVFDFELNPEEMEAMDGLDKGRRAFHYPTAFEFKEYPFKMFQSEPIWQTDIERFMG